MSNERKPHQHAQVIKAWADGSPIQYKDEVDAKWRDTIEPCWFDALQYRAKPEPVKVRYRVFAARRVHDGTIMTMTAESDETAKHFSALPSFICWLTDWIEVEIPQ